MGDRSGLKNSKGDRSFILGDRSSETTKGDRTPHNDRSIWCEGRSLLMRDGRSLLSTIIAVFGIWCEGRSLNSFLYTYQSRLSG